VHWAVKSALAGVHFNFFVQLDISGSEDTNGNICNKSSMVISLGIFQECPFLYILQSLFRVSLASSDKYPIGKMDDCIISEPWVNSQQIIPRILQGVISLFQCHND
jgi:hypothetical protein